MQEGGDLEPGGRVGPVGVLMVLVVYFLPNGVVPALQRLRAPPAYVSPPSHAETEKIEVKKAELSDAEIDAKIKEKLQALSKAMESHNTYSGETVDGELVLVDAKTD